MHEEWVGRLGDEAIRRAVGAEAFERGDAYARQGRVSQLRIPTDGRTVFARVRGQRPAPYQTFVTLGRSQRGTGQRWFGHCTCPLATNCKHVAAVLLVARERVGGRDAGGARADAWERSVAELLQASEPSDTGLATPIGLQLEVVNANGSGVGSSAPSPGTAGGGRIRIRIRPVVPGKNGGWIRTGISWRDLHYDYDHATHVRAHRRALRELYRVHQPKDNGYYSYGDTPIYIDEFGQLVWPLLEQAVDAGVQLVSAKASAGPVVLARTPAQLALDLTRCTGTSEATLEPVLSLGDITLDAGSMGFLGDPVHGLFIPAADGQVPVGMAPSPALLLAPLGRPATARISHLLTSGRPLTIPAGALDRFLHDYYPGLRQIVPVTSSNDSVALPEIAPPKLSLLVTYAPDHRVTLEWSFAYEVDGVANRVPLSPQGEHAGRDVRAEQSLLLGLPLSDDRLPQLRERTPERRLASPVELRGMDAVVFTEEVLPALQERDDVLVQVVGVQPEYRHVEASPLIQVSTSDSPDHPDWFDLGVTVSLDGEEVPFQPLFLALAHGDSHLVLDSGAYFSIDRPELEQLRRLIDEARALQDRESDGLRISRYQAGLWEELMELGVVEAQSERWAASVGRLLELDQIVPPPLPGALDAELRPYQLEGYRWLTFLWEHGLGGILADDMGLGKTVQTLAMICRARETGDLPSPVLVVAPTSVVSSWTNEATRFAPELNVVAVTETEARAGSTLADRAAGADLVLTSYALFRIDFERYDALPWSGLVLDEAQFVKNHQAKTYQCAKRLAAPFKLAITGTPLENGLMDLWSLLSIVAPGLFSNPQRFSEFYRNPIERGTDPELLSTLRRRIRPLMRRRTKEQVVAELPPKQEQVLELALNPRHRKIYETHLQRERQKVLGLISNMDKNRFAIFRSLTLLRQLSLDPALIDDKYSGVRSSKVDAFVEQVHEVAREGHRALVFSQFTGFLRRVRERLDAEGLDYCYLDGRTRHRAKRIEEFKTGDAPVFLISLKAGGFGLNLTEADYCFVLDPWWNPAVEAQAVDRAHRIGQDKTVMVYRLVSVGTIEEKVMALKARKEELFKRVLDDDGLLSASLTADDIKGLLAS